MKSDRIILHSDLNCFYASVEIMLNPALRGKPVAVCGNTQDRHGIVLAKSQQAKLAGVKTAMTNWQAKRLCPELIFIEPHFEQYAKYSRLAKDIYMRYTDLVEPFGMDECWLDVTGSTRLFGSGEKIANEIRESMKKELGLSVSVGVSFNKIFAKLGSDLKKPDAVTSITRQNFKDKVWPLPAGELLFVGRSAVKKLDFYGVHTIGQLAQTDPEILKSWFGVTGAQMFSYANGTDSSPVTKSDFESEIKSIGHGVTCTKDLTNESEVWHVILELAQDIGHRLRSHRLAACGVQISIKKSDLSSRQHQCTLNIPTQSPMTIAKTARELFDKNYDSDFKIRAVSVRAINLLTESENFQLDLFTDYDKVQKQARLDTAVEEIRRRFGKKAVRNASLMGEINIPHKRNDEILLPGQRR